jgi:hypothetical protein
MYPLQKRRAFFTLPLFLSKKSRSRRTKKKNKKKAPFSLSLFLSLSLLFLNFCVPKKRALSLSLFFLASRSFFTGRHDSSFCRTFLRGVKKVLSLRPFRSPPSPFLSLSLLPSRKKVVKRERGRKRFATQTLPGNSARATLESKSEKEETI